MPIAYHGRASSIVLSGTPVHRPCGQIKVGSDDTPVYAPSRMLDYELELGAFSWVLAIPWASQFQSPMPKIICSACAY